MNLPTNHNLNSTSRYNITLISMTILLVIIFIQSLSSGRYDISYFQVFDILCNGYLSSFIGVEKTWTDTMQTIVLTLRLPRTLAAVLIGSALAISGAAYQSLFKNPMVSPSLLGVSSGASVGAALAIVFGYTSGLIQVWAFFGGLLAVTITASIPRLLRSESIMALILAGIVVEGLMASVMGVIKYFADPETALAEIVYWTMGSVKNTTILDLYTIAPGIIIALIFMLLVRYRFNVLALGENEAKTLGINVKVTRRIIILLATFLTAASVCLAGTIGWVGLVIPHLGRMLVGADNQRMLPVATVMGAIFMIVVDTFSRSISSAELPLGILTGIIGAPFYLYLLARNRNKQQI